MNVFSDREDRPEPEGAADGVRVLQVEDVGRRWRRGRVVVLLAITLVGSAVFAVLLGALQMQREPTGGT